MRRLLEPTLQRRVLLAMTLAFVLVWLVLTVHGVSQVMDTQAREKGVRKYAEMVAEQIDNLDDPARATEFVAGVERLQNRFYGSDNAPMKLVLYLWDKQGNPLFTSEQQKGHTALQGVANRVVWVNIDDRAFAVYRLETKHWNIVVARAYVTAGWASAMIAKGLLPQFGIAYLVAIPVIWLAVSRGLLPLRDMSRRIAARDPDDLSGTGILPKYGEMKPLQQALDGLLDKLRSKVARETAFVQEAAHELRTPMALISAQAHVLALAQDPASRLEAEQRLDRALARASHLVGQLLQLAHMDGARSVDAIDMDVAQEARAELAMLVPGARQRGIELRLQAPDTLCVRLEREAFQSILQNLVGNAIRYIEPACTIVVSLSHQDERLLLTVADNGPGIAPEQQKVVFERFHRGDDPLAHGAGLGLAIVKQACVRLGGSVRLAPGLDGRGCQFVVDILASGAH